MYEPAHETVGSGGGTINGISFSNIDGNFSGGVFQEGSKYHYLSGVAVSGGSLLTTGSNALSGLADMQLTPVPLPAAGYIFLAALAGLGMIKRKNE